jgi:EAL domain-containing protein (putative c-di-GMP-specific phosphodiesterase class I)
MMDELQRDLEQNKLTLHYQPKYRIRQGVIDSAEALVRWTSETFGAVSPGQFIPMAEETGEIGPLTDWSIKQALNDQARLAAAGYPLKVAVNLSATLVCDDAFTNRILGLVGPRTQAILLELTESAVFGNGERAIANLQRLADAGIQIAIDDYGTGMSSLAYLQKLPIRELKIDRMFISNLTRSHRDPLLEIEVVAEGIEDAATLALLRVMGCDVAQGYFIARPMALERLIAYLAEKPAEKLNTPLDAKAFLASAIR